MGFSIRGFGTRRTRFERAWGVEYLVEGEKQVYFDYSKHSAPKEAKEAFSKHMRIPWEVLEERGAKTIRRSIEIIPPRSPSKPNGEL